MLQRRVHGAPPPTAGGGGSSGPGTGSLGGAGGSARGEPRPIGGSRSTDSLPLNRWAIPDLPASESIDSTPGGGGGVGAGRGAAGGWQPQSVGGSVHTPVGDSMPPSPAVDFGIGRVSTADSMRDSDVAPG